MKGCFFGPKDERVFEYKKMKKNNKIKKYSNTGKIFGTLYDVQRQNKVWQASSFFQAIRNSNLCKKHQYLEIQIEKILTVQ